MIRRFLRRLAVLVAVILAALALTIKLRYGGGGDFPDRSGAPQWPDTVLETVADLPTPPGNIAVSSDGRVFVSLHPEAHPQTKVAELVNGRVEPFPNEAFQSGAGEPRYFRAVLGIRIDRQGRLWTLDNGNHGLAPARLLAFDLATRRVVHEYVFPRKIAGYGSHLNDFQVSPDGETVYIADASIFAKNPALIVYDLKTRRARRLLEGHPSVTPDYFTPVVQGRRMELFGLFAIRPGVDSIALDAAGEWLYFAPVTSLNLYRARTADLRNAQLSGSDLAGRVEVYAAKTMSDGITMDTAGNVYLGDPEHSAIVLLRPDRSLQTLVKTDRLRWPDGFSFGPDGWLYLTCSALNQVLGRTPTQWRAQAPFQVYRLRPGPPGIPGH